MTDKDNKPNVTVDFDGVIHSYKSGWISADEAPDPPVDGAEDFLRELNEHYEVNILSSRTPADGGIEEMKRYVGEHFGKDLEQELHFPETKPAYNIMTIDDNVICFNGEFPSVDDIKNFTPWHKEDTMKVVKNTCFGGFGLSVEAMAEFVKRDSDLIKKKDLSEWSSDLENEEINSFDDFIDAKCKHSVLNETTIDGTPREEYYRSRHEDIEIDGKIYYYETGMSSPALFYFSKDETYYYSLPIFMSEHRHHEDLVSIVEDLGESANGPHADLEIVDVPESIGENYEIDSYDGRETIKEPHRSW